MRKDPEEIKINTDFIRLDALLKLCAAVGSGGEAKTVIQEGLVEVDGEVCSQRGKKLYDGDRVSFNGESYLIRGEEK